MIENISLKLMELVVLRLLLILNIKNNYYNQNRDPKFVYKQYVGEVSLNPFIKKPYMKNYYPIQVFDLIFHADFINRKKMTFWRT